MSNETPRGLTLRKLADKQGRDERPICPETGKEKPWPLLGVVFVDDPPAYAVIPTDFATRAAAEGWLTIEGEQIVTRPGGPPEDPWRPDKVHVFRQATALVIHSADLGDVRYVVEQQPDKDESGVRHEYLARREG